MPHVNGTDTLRDQHLDLPTDELVTSITKQALHLLIHERDDAIATYDQHGVRCSFEQLAKPVTLEKALHAPLLTSLWVTTRQKLHLVRHPRSRCGRHELRPRVCRTSSPTPCWFARYLASGRAARTARTLAHAGSVGHHCLDRRRRSASRPPRSRRRL